MNKQLRRLGAGLLACYLALFAMVNWVQVFHAQALNEHPTNTRKIVRDFNRPRGQIIAADGAVLAKTVPSAPGDPFIFQRTYPEGDLFGHITGTFNFNFGATGVEQTYNDQLSGATVSQEYETLRDLFVDRQHTGDVTLTLRKDVQQLARRVGGAEGLGRGARSARRIDPRDVELPVVRPEPAWPRTTSTDAAEREGVPRGETPTGRCADDRGRNGSSPAPRSRS